MGGKGIAYWPPAPSPLTGEVRKDKGHSKHPMLFCMANRGMREGIGGRFREGFPSLFQLNYLKLFADNNLRVLLESRYEDVLTTPLNEKG